MRRTLPPPSLMVRKFLNSGASSDKSAQDSTASLGSIRVYPAPADSFEERYCFFYGSLMDPETLSRVLETSEPLPAMSPAKILGYKTKLWGPYPALLDGETLQRVDGMVFELSSKTQLDRLAAYETDRYKLHYCIVHILKEDDTVESTVNGVTFMWNGEENELQEGQFDLKQWKKEKRLWDLDSVSN